MSARAHVCVVLLLASTSTVGCLFGGGGDKERAPQPAQSVAPGPVAAQPVTAAPVDGPARETTGPLAPVPRRDPREVDEVVARALGAKRSDVEWPGSSAFGLVDDEAVEPAVDVPDLAHADAVHGAESAIPPGRAARSLTNFGRTIPEASDSHANLSARGPGALDGGGVANEQIELPEAAAEPSPKRAASVAASSTGAGDLAATLAQRLRDNPGDLAVHLDFQLLRFLQDEPVPDLDAIAGLPGEDRELLTAVVDALSNFRNGARADNNMLLSQKIKPLLDLAGRLRSQAELSIPTIALCSKVKRFGIYEPMPGRFAAGRVSNFTLVYCELDNVSARKNEKGEWESRLSQQAVLYKEDGQAVWSNERHSVTDRSRNRRQDFFSAQTIELLPSLAIGRYLLKVTVEDEQVRRVAEATVPIEIVAALPPQPQQQLQQQQKQPQQPNKQQPPAAGPAEPSDAPIAEQQELEIPGSDPRQASDRTRRDPRSAPSNGGGGRGAITGTNDAGDLR